MKRIIIGVILFIGSFTIQAQYWETVGGGMSAPVRDVYADTIDNVLYAVGNFGYAGDSAVLQIGAWKDGGWHRVGNGTNDPFCLNDGCNPVFSITRHNNYIFIGGLQSTLPGPIKYLARWDGNNWLSDGNPNSPVCLLSINDQLFCTGGNFDTIGGQPINTIARWNAGSWQQFVSPPPFNLLGWGISCGEYYNGNYYFGGNFSDLSNFNDIAGWDGTQWFPLQNGLSGGMANIFDIVAFQNYLFVGGYFHQSDGNVADYLMAWDGQNWFDPFPSVQFTYTVSDLAVLNNDLYIAGWHSHVGDTNVYGLAKFDGVNFCSIGGANNFLIKIAELNDTLYAATQGIFDGDTAKWIASMPINTPADTCVYQPLNIQAENIQSHSINLYPNPTTDLVYISFPGVEINTVSYSILNTLGEKISTGFISENNYQVDLTNFPNGMYTIEIIWDHKKICKKLLKMN